MSGNHPPAAGVEGSAEDDEPLVEKLVEKTVPLVLELVEPTQTEDSPGGDEADFLYGGMEDEVPLVEDSPTAYMSEIRPPSVFVFDSRLVDETYEVLVALMRNRIEQELLGKLGREIGASLKVQQGMTFRAVRPLILRAARDALDYIIEDESIREKVKI